MRLYSRVAEKLQFIAPEFYKKRFFKNLQNLSTENILEKKVEPELLWISQQLHKSDVFFDIGANVGTYLYMIESIVKHENIFAFEPNRKLYFRLKRIFPNMRIFRLALSDKNVVAELKVPVIAGEMVNSIGNLQTDFREDKEETSIKDRVKVIKLDDWAEIEHFKKINFIKIDVEGNEIATVKGAEKTIRRFKPTMIVEIEQRHHKEPVWNFISEVQRWGYTANFLNKKNLKPEPLSQDFFEKQNRENVKNYDSYINNIIFIPI